MRMCIWLDLLQGKSSRAGSSRSLGSNISLHLTHQDAIRKKYSSPSEEDDIARRNDDDHVLDDDSSISSNTGVPKYGSARNRILERSSQAKGLYHQPPKHPYSTSASDSEDAHAATGAGESNLYTNKALSHSRSSLASQSSTITNKSTGSGGGFRRTKFRSSAASNRSTGSDRTITNETPEAYHSNHGNNGAKHEEQTGAVESLKDKKLATFKAVDLSNETAPLSLDLDVKSRIQKSSANCERSLPPVVSSCVKKQSSFESGRAADSGIDSQISQTSQSSPPQRQARHQLATATASQGVNDTQQTPAGGAATAQSMESPAAGAAKPAVPVKPKLGSAVSAAISKLAGQANGAGDSATSTTIASNDVTKIQTADSLKDSTAQHQSAWYNQGDTTEDEEHADDITDSAHATARSAASQGQLQATLDPTALAHKVMMETMTQKRSLDAMQHWSMRNLQKKRVERQMSGESVEPATTASSAPAGSPAAVSTSTNSSSMTAQSRDQPALDAQLNNESQGVTDVTRMLEGIDVSSTLSDSSMEKVPTPTQVIPTVLHHTVLSLKHVKVSI